MSRGTARASLPPRSSRRPRFPKPSRFWSLLLGEKGTENLGGGIETEYFEENSEGLAWLGFEGRVFG